MMFTLRLKLILLGILISTLTVAGTIHYIRNTGRSAEKVENLQNQVIVRERIDESIRRAPRDVDAALRLLRERQNQ
jgi:hypothetical protein